jgi:hypothetical protein
MFNLYNLPTEVKSICTEDNTNFTKTPSGDWYKVNHDTNDFTLVTKPTFNNINVDQLQAEVPVIELSEYNKDLIELREQCREGLIMSANQFKDIIIEMSLKHETMSKHILMDLFVC